MHLSRLITWAILMGVFTTIHGQKITISGYVEDSQTGERLIGCNVMLKETTIGTTSNNFGFYSITLEGKDTVRLIFSYLGYSPLEKMFFNSSENYTARLDSDLLLDEIEITANKDLRIENESRMSTVEVPIQQIKKIPALMGETDILKALQLLPGVQSGGEGQSGFYVRGGSPDQNLILLDGVPVYNANHLFGFFSVFNADAIKDVSLIKGGFPARYGGRLSSVLEINLKDGNTKDITGDFSIGLVGSKLTLQGPIKKEKTSFLISGRRTYIDLLSRPFIKNSFRNSGSDGNTGYYFYDLNAKVNHIFSDRDRVYLSVYGGNDKFYLNEKDIGSSIRDYSDNNLGWGNLTAAFRWTHLITDKMFMNSTLTFSRYRLKTGVEYGTIFLDDFKESIGLEYVSGITDLGAKIDFDYVPSPQHFIRFGANIIRHDFNPGVFKLSQVSRDVLGNINQTIGQQSLNALEMALYIEDDYELNSQLKINYGVHMSGFQVQKSFYPSVQPRLSARYLLPSGIAIKASWATMRQFINLLSFEGIGLPTDLWLPTTDRIQPQSSWQAAIGIAKTIQNEYEFSVETYYKKMSNLIAYRDGSGLFELSDWQDRVTQGDGNAYGFEVFLQKKTGKLSGWLGYTLSWNNRTFIEINQGRSFPYRYDRRHDVSVVGLYDVSKRINLSATWVYGTGNAVTLPRSEYYSIVKPNFLDDFISQQITQYGDRNSYRMRAYHRLDIGINFIKNKNNRTRTWSLGAYNVYIQNNPFYVYLSSEDVNGTYETVLKQASLFPIIPYVTYSLKF